MRCPKCKSEGKTHSVNYQYSNKTLMGGGGEFYDENDERHDHDPNTVVDYYTCSNGHRWSAKYIPKCPNKKCDYGHDPVLMDSSWGEGVGRWNEPTEEMIEVLK